MRKILALAVTLALLPALFACGRAEDEPTSETTTKTASTTETETTTEAEVTRDCPWGQDEIAVLDTITLFYKVS
ncbi:MAG: hypothetical protein FWF60_03090, partial [Oscillospiraceae bacterium]|nr:hypothetical protein [Oscillospiraceae bacterium]